MSVVALITVAALVSAIACITADYTGKRQRFYVLKPLTMLIIIALALVIPDTDGNHGLTAYRSWIVAALCFSLLGDILLMLPRDRFLSGLAAFLLAHWCYIAGLAGLPTAPNVLLLLPWFAAGVAVFVLLRPGSQRMRIAVPVYIVSIVLMGWLAVEHWRLSGAGGVVAIAAILFLLSDTLIGFRRFRGTWPSAQPMILGSYFPAQWLFAMSPAFI